MMVDIFAQSVLEALAAIVGGLVFLVAMLLVTLAALGPEIVGCVVGLVAKLSSLLHAFGGVRNESVATRNKVEPVSRLRR